MEFITQIIDKFTGKKRSKDGTAIYKYKSPRTNKEVAQMLYIEEINEHFERVFPGRNTKVFHEIISETIHIDIHVMEPNEEEPYYVLYTSGMSDLPMTMPRTMAKDMKKELCRGELMIFLPADWPMTEDELKNTEYFWPLRLMKTLARFPHQFKTWLGYGHTIPNFAEYEPYGKETGLNGVVLYQLKEEMSTINTKDGTLINLYFLIPLYKQEMEFKLDNGMDALMERLMKKNENIFILNHKRKNTVIS